MFSRTRVFVCALALSVSIVSVAIGQLSNAADHPSIAYTASEPDDAIARLQRKIDAGEVRLEFSGEHGYLASVLRHLNIPLSSQGLVFSKTSLQLDRIAPWSPRALYFNDDVYVGWVQGGPIIEVASVDPKLGAVFYSLPQNADTPPVFQRETTTCLVCHDSASVTGGVPGLIVRSMYTDRYGYGISAIGKSVTTDQTAIEERWGGWYVTGTHGSQRHAGNVMAPVLAHEVGNTRNYMTKVDLGAGGNVKELKDRFDTTAYLKPHSDIVALMVLAHQASVHNLITSAGYVGRSGLSDIKNAAERLVRAMLFVREAPLAAKLEGTSGFAAEFSSRGPRDSKGRSLRDLDLERRVFRYPLSFLVYSEQFDTLPSVIKQHVYSRLHEILSGSDQSKDFAHLSEADRRAIIEILEETKPEFARAVTK